MNTGKTTEEFWILWKSGYKNQATVTTKKPKEYNDSLAHVIEYSAYEQLKKENAELKKTLESVNNCKIGDLVVYHPVKEPDSDNVFETINLVSDENLHLKSYLRTSDLNRQSLWADSLKLVDENALLKSNLKVAVDNFEKIKNVECKQQACSIAARGIALLALKEIGEVK